MKSDKMSNIIYANIESLSRKMDVCANNPKNSSTTKKGEHIPCGYSMSTIWAFDQIETKHTLYFGKDCMKKFGEYLRENTKNIINFEKILTFFMLPLTKEELDWHQKYVIFAERKS